MENYKVTAQLWLVDEHGNQVSQRRHDVPVKVQIQDYDDHVRTYLQHLGTDEFEILAGTTVARVVVGMGEWETAVALTSGPEHFTANGTYTVTDLRLCAEEEKEVG